MSEVPTKWRPTLAMITAGMMAMLLLLAFGGFAMVRANVDLPADEEILAAAALALVGAGVLGAVFVRTISRPMGDLKARADAIGGGDRSAIGPLRHHGTRELAAVTHSFMDMAASLSRQSDHLRTFARHVSHEFKTPLTSMRGAAELMLDNPEMAPDEQRRFLQNIAGDVARLDALIERLNELARADQADFVGATTLAALARDLGARFPALTIETGGAVAAPFALAHENAMIVFTNLADNALRHRACRLVLDCELDVDAVAIVVVDNGEGISPGNRNRVFDPFFTTRRDAGGTGMGLAIVRSLIEAHGGTVSLGAAAAGTRLDLRIPRAPARELHERT